MLLVAVSYKIMHMKMKKSRRFCVRTLACKTKLGLKNNRF
jgi:hypothetical protein